MFKIKAKNLYMVEAQELTVGKNVAVLKVAPLAARCVRKIKMFFFLASFLNLINFDLKNRSKMVLE